MLKSSTRRWLAGLGVAGAFVAASATPALAAPAADVELYFPDATVAVGSAGTVKGPHLFSSAPAVLNEVSFRYDFSSLAGKVTIAADTGGDCATETEGVVVCREYFPVVVDPTYGALLTDVVIAPTEKAVAGDSGALKVTLQVAGKERASYTSRLRVGEGVDLIGGPETEVEVPVGGAFQVPMTVLNGGETTVKGLVAVFDNDYGIRTKERFDNCLYADDWILACEFDEEIPAGEGRTATLNYQLAKDVYAPGSEFGDIWFVTPDDFEELLGVRKEAGAETVRRGTGRELKLEAMPAARSARAAQTDTDPSNSHSNLYVKVTGKNGADLAAIGATLKGTAGAVVTATVGFRNNGPATLEHLRTESDVTFVDVTVPDGTTAVEVPAECAPRVGNGADWAEAGTPGGREYRCYPGPFAPAGEELTGDFRLRIDKVIANATGTVKVNVPCECEGGFQADLNPANDTAKILVNATGNGGDNGQGGGGGDGGSLPITGSSTGLIAGIGALLLVAGAGGYLVARRRKTRFVA